MYSTIFVRSLKAYVGQWCLSMCEMGQLFALLSDLCVARPSLMTTWPRNSLSSRKIWSQSLVWAWTTWDLTKIVNQKLGNHMSKVPVESLGLDDITAPTTKLRDLNLHYQPLETDGWTDSGAFSCCIIANTTHQRFLDDQCWTWLRLCRVDAGQFRALGGDCQ